MMQESEGPEVGDNAAGGGIEDEASALEFPDAPEIKEVEIETYEDALIAAESALVAMESFQVGEDDETQRHRHSLEVGMGWLESQGNGPPLRVEQAEHFATFLETVAERHEKSVENARGAQDLVGTAPKEDFDILDRRRATRATGIRALASNIRAVAEFEKTKEIT